ncbi:hypothetical protein BGZ99_008512 [Dissophora globulifera]|uniref:Uncharacterized protein n=1 Tax=Dissophora globulifera TaxID=979702 RepID=A0A9P6R752_9FUNG|nr:hypothetical protein BGZ99_008512 [Dissophora globulifera]
MTDEKDDPLMPLRVEYHEDCILDVIADTASEDNKVQPPSNTTIAVPIPIPLHRSDSSQSTAPTTPASSFSSSFASPHSISPASIAPLSIVRSSLTAALTSVPEASYEFGDNSDESDALSRDIFGTLAAGSTSTLTIDGHARSASATSSTSASQRTVAGMGTDLNPISVQRPDLSHGIVPPTAPSLSTVAAEAKQEPLTNFGSLPKSEVLDRLMSGPLLFSTVQTVHTMPIEFFPEAESQAEETLTESETLLESRPLPPLPGPHGEIYQPNLQQQQQLMLPPHQLRQLQLQQQYQEQLHQQQQQHQQHQTPYSYQTQPFPQHQPRYLHDHHQYQHYTQEHQHQQHTQGHQTPPNDTTPTSPPIPPRPVHLHNMSSSTLIHPLHRPSIGHAPQTSDPDGRAIQPISPILPTLPSQRSFESLPRQSSPPLGQLFRSDSHMVSKIVRTVQGNDTALMSVPLGLNISTTIGSVGQQYQESDTKLKDLEMKLRRAQDQAKAYAGKSHAISQESMQTSAKIVDKAAEIQAKVQAVLTMNQEIHENPLPRLFVILPVLMPESSATVAAATTTTPTEAKPSLGDQRRFRLHFLCDCGHHTRPLRSSGLNHIHYVEHEGYEITHPAEFFDNYGPFIRSLSHLIRKGAHFGSVSIAPLVSSAQQTQQQHVQDANGIYRATVAGQEMLKNKILDTRLAETIDYLDSLESMDPSEMEESNNDVGQYFDGTDFRQLLAYVKIPPQEVQSLSNLYRIVTSGGHVKWICEDHYQSTIHHQNELLFQTEIAALGGQYDFRTGRAKVQLASDKDATHLYKCMSKAHNLHELDIGFKWSYTDSDLGKFVQAVNESKIRVLSVDGCKQKTEAQGIKLKDFRKNYHAMLRIFYGSKIESMTLINMPSLLLRISTKDTMPVLQGYGVRLLHMENIGMVEHAETGKSTTATALGIHIKLGNSTRNPPLLFLKTMFTSYQLLAEISLPGINIRDEGVALFVDQTHLKKTIRKVNFNNNGISSIGGRMLAMFLAREKALTHLDLGMNAIEDETLVQVIEALGPKLRVLNLENTGFRENAAKALEKMVETYNSPSNLVSQLECLNLATNAWTTSSIQSLGRTIMQLRPRDSPPSSPASASPSARNYDKPNHLEMGPAESFFVINAMIKTSQISLPTDKPWYQLPDILASHAALTATKDAHSSSVMRAMDTIAANSKLKVLRLEDSGLSDSAARYMVELLDVSILTKLDLRRCVKLFKPREILKILTKIYPNSAYQQEGDSIQQPRQGVPHGPTPYGIVGTPQNALRFIHLNSTGVDDHVARVLAQDLETGWSCIERLDLGSNHLTHQGITLILNALCHNTSLQHLNLGQNFSAVNMVYPSAASALAQSTRDALRRFMLTNKTLQVLYFISADIEVVAKGLNVNTTIKSLVFDRLEGTFSDVEAFGRALAVNTTLMRFKVYDNRLPPFLQAFYSPGQQIQQHHSSFHQSFHNQHQQQPQQQQIRYVDPFREFKQEAIKTIENGVTFNNTLIELQWPEMFDRMQPWTARLDTILMRNMMSLKNGGFPDNHSESSHDTVGSSSGSRMMRGITRGLSVLSTNSTVSKSSDASSSTSSLSSLSSSVKDLQGMNQSNSGFLTVGSPPTGLSDEHTHSIHNGNDGGNSGNRRRSGTAKWDERKLSILELSPKTLDQLRNTPTREQKTAVQMQAQQQVQQQQQQRQRATSVAADTHIMQRFQKK